MTLTFGEVQSFVTDLGVAKDFYVNILGLTLVDEAERWLVIDVSGNQFILMSGAEPGPPRKPYGTECGTVLCLLSEDIDRDYRALTAKGVRFFSEVNEVPQGRYVGFQDPDGNLLELIQK
jgi:predicted enzyme related to lactoylglutathione lyase